MLKILLGFFVIFLPMVRTLPNKIDGQANYYLSRRYLEPAQNVVIFLAEVDPEAFIAKLKASSPWTTTDMQGKFEFTGLTSGYYAFGIESSKGERMPLTDAVDGVRWGFYVSSTVPQEARIDYSLTWLRTTSIESLEPSWEWEVVLP